LALGVLGLVSVAHADWLLPAALGAALFVVPQLYFTHYTFRCLNRGNAALLAHSIRWGQLGKFLLTLVGFALVWRFYPGANVLVLMCVYGLFWLAQVFIANALTKTLTQ
jgi:ATP synthase protein I